VGEVGSAGAGVAAQGGPGAGVTAAERPRAAVKRDLRAMLGDGVAFSLMVGLGETYVPAFALAAGLGAVTSGLVATLPMLAGAALQLVTPAGVARLGSYRRWVVASATLQAASFAPLVAGGLGDGISRAWLFGAMALYWGAGMSTGPAWNAWVGALVPHGRRARFFARRSLLCQASLLAAILGAGVYLERAAGPDDPLVAFGWLFAVASACRLASAGFLRRQSEPAGLVASHRRLASPGAWRAVRGSEGRRVLLYLLGMQVAVQICAPYFTAYMLGPLALSYGGYMVLTAGAFASRVAILPLLGRFAHARGSRALFRVGALGIVPLPALWLVSDDFAYLFGLQLVAGAVWAALELATLLSFFETLEERDRTSILTAFNFASAVAMAIGTLVGALLFSAVEPGRAAYALLFVASSLARLLVLVALPSPRPATHAPAEVSLRTLAVRPSAGAIQRPVLPTLDEDEAAEEARSS
jgi:MFS family permease